MQEADPLLLPVPLDLKAPTFEGCVAHTQAESSAIKIDGVPSGFPTEAFEKLRGVLNLALYLCSEEPDLSASPRRVPPLVQHYRPGASRWAGGSGRLCAKPTAKGPA